jgi:hypothetical protein
MSGPDGMEERTAQYDEWGDLMAGEYDEAANRADMERLYTEDTEY